MLKGKAEAISEVIRKLIIFMDTRMAVAVEKQKREMESAKYIWDFGGIPCSHSPRLARKMVKI